MNPKMLQMQLEMLESRRGFTVESGGAFDDPDAMPAATVAAADVHDASGRDDLGVQLALLPGLHMDPRLSRLGVTAAHGEQWSVLAVAPKREATFDHATLSSS